MAVYKRQLYLLKTHVGIPIPSNSIENTPGHTYNQIRSIALVFPFLLYTLRTVVNVCKAVMLTDTATLWLRGEVLRV